MSASIAQNNIAPHHERDDKSCTKITCTHATIWSFSLENGEIGYLGWVVAGGEDFSKALGAETAKHDVMFFGIDTRRAFKNALFVLN